MKEYLHFAWKVAVALVIIYAILDLVARFTGVNLKGYLTSPLASILPAASGS